MFEKYFIKAVLFRVYIASSKQSGDLDTGEFSKVMQSYLYNCLEFSRPPSCLDHEAM